MSTVAELPILADRYTPCVRTIRVVGVDLTGVDMRAQVRQRGDTPGAPDVDLATVTNGNAEGLRLLGVSFTDGVPTSAVELVINETTMEGLPYQGEVGDTTALAWDWQATFAGRKRRIAAGPFLIAGDGVTGADNAPAARPVGYGMSSAAGGGMRAGATLTFGDEIVEVRIDGVDLLQPLLGDALAARADAVAAAQQAQTLAGSIVPYGAVTNNGVVNGRTQLSASFAAPVFQDGGLLDLFIPGDVIGPVSLKTDQTGGGYLRILDENTSELEGVAFPAGSVVRLKLNLAGVVWLTVSETPGLDYIRGIGSDASGAKNTLEAVYGLPLALPIAGDPNKVAFSSFPAPANGATFEAVVTVTNTGRTFIYANGPYLRVAQPGTGADIAAGALVAGTVVTLIRSDEGGAIALLVGSRPLVQDAVPPPVASRAPALVEQPWGAITFPNGGHAQVAPVDVPLVVIGSSNGHPDYVAAGAVPADMLVSALNGYTPGTGIRFVVDNAATPGAPWTDAGRQLGTSAAFAQGRARLVASIFGMNEARSTFYHDYGGLPAQERAVRDSVAYIRSMGSEPVLNTIFHCDPRDMSGLEPTYFADNASRDMVYPASKAHPVSPTLDMVPPSTGLASEPLDWTGGGVLRTGSARIWDVNRMLRRVAAELNCKLLDFEWLFFRACIETVPDLSDALDTFFTRGNPLHPLKPVYDRAVTPILRQLARALVDGRDDMRVFRGPGA